MRPFAKLSARQWDMVVSLDDYDKAPFAFNGTIGTTKVAYPRQHVLHTVSNRQSVGLNTRGPRFVSWPALPVPDRSTTSL
ncbi:MAG: hypothetical protein WA746_08650, partial [Isosphaeraceae bacterium]